MKYTEEYSNNLPSVRIINIQANDIYLANCITHSELNIKNTDMFDDHFSDVMEPSLDLLYLNQKGKLTLKTLQDEFYTYDLINVSFSHPLWLDKKNKKVFKIKERAKVINAKEIRKELYLKGFVLNKTKYVRYKRSAGSAKGGSCLFIKEELYSMMTKWSRTGLDTDKDLCFKNLTTYEAYRALSLSSLKKVLRLNPRNILFVKDFKTIVKDQKVISVAPNDHGHLECEVGSFDIENNIFDGEGLLDVSVFEKCKLERKGMMLLRNRFFKCCAFNTNLQKWFAKNNIKCKEQLNGITFAEDIKDIVLVVTESCLKYLKMCEGGFTEENIKRWCDSICDGEDSLFGIVKTDKKTRFFGGEMVETTYQLLNTLQLKDKDIRLLTAPYIEYINKVKDLDNTPEFLIYFLESEKNASKNIQDDSEGEIEEKLLEQSSYLFKGTVCLDLLQTSSDTKYTTLVKNRVYKNIISSFALKLLNGRILVDGTYATLFGNPYEFLRYIVKQDDIPLFGEELKTSLLKEGEICCSFFKDGESIVGSRAPHTTMGNILCGTNRMPKEIKTWFNLSKNIVVVDAINNNIQHRLSGCDYDSDSMLLTNNETIVNAARKNYKNFYVPYANFASQVKPMKDLSNDKKENLSLNLNEIDNKIALNNVGKIVNLSQLLNSHLWHQTNTSRGTNTSEIYNKIAILSVLSGAEIDSSKRSFPFDTSNELRLIKKYSKEKGYSNDKPVFFANISNAKQRKLRFGEIRKQFTKNSTFKKTSMDSLWKFIGENKVISTRIKTKKLFDIVGSDFKTQGLSKNKYSQVESAIKALEKTRVILFRNNIQKRNSTNYELNKKEFLIQIRKCYQDIHLNINSVDKVKLLIRNIESKSKTVEIADSLLYILLYIIKIKQKDLGFGIKDLFPQDSVGIASLTRTKFTPNSKYTIFNKYTFAIKKPNKANNKIVEKIAKSDEISTC